MFFVLQEKLVYGKLPDCIFNRVIQTGSGYVLDRFTKLDPDPKIVLHTNPDPTFFKIQIQFHIRPKTRILFNTYSSQNKLSYFRII